ncbi:MAG TPA: hypothetical protein VK949_03000 [Methylotenera sp.]|nr:hypothetical protein [Methylotenera sp.]
MLVKKIKDSLLANVSQQISSIFLFLLIPRILTVDDYAIVVFVAVLLSFSNLGDLGFTFVYSTKMPVIYQRNDKNEIQEWNSTAFWFGIIGSLIVGCLLSITFYIKFSHPLYASFIFLLLPVMFITSFHIMQFTSLENFSSYRNLIFSQSVIKLLTILFSYMMGLLGWFVNQFFMYSLTIKKLINEGLPPIKKFNHHLIKSHFLNGVLLISVFFLWNQLLGSGRLLAAFNYEKSIIADYGLMSTGYQILSSLLIATFIPFSVSTLKMIEVDDKIAIERIFKAIYIAIPCVLVLVMLAETLAPFLFKLLFKKYQYDSVVFKSFLYSLFLSPIVVTLGNVYIGKKKLPLYIGILGISFLSAILSFYYLLPTYQTRAAALAQLLGTTICAVLMLGVACYIFRKTIQNISYKIATLFLMSLVIIMIEYWIIN